MPYKDPEAKRAATRRAMAKAAAAGKSYATLNSKARRKAKRAQDAGPPRKPVFVAIDGEGTNQPDGDQWYTLMAARTIDGTLDPNLDSKVSSIERYSHGGLATEACIRWLLDIGYWRNQTYVSFFFNYDVNKMLHDLSHDELVALWDGNWIVWAGRTDNYYIKWIPSKFLEVAEYRGKPDEKFNHHRHLGRRTTIYDTSGFFQSSFVKALEKWDITTPEDIAKIAAMKERRNDFVADEHREIRAYCQQECYSLCAIMNKLADALWDAGLYLQEWHGAGAIAKKLFALNGVKEHLETPPEEVEEAILGAYFGGRIELFRQGYFPEGVYDYDLQSAYPSAAITLPSLKGATWTHKSYNSGNGLVISRIPETERSSREALWLLSWDVTEPLKGSRSKRTAKKIVGPLPFRFKGRITFPFRAGPTWVHADEAATAVDIFGADSFTLHEVWSFVPANDSLPFGFLQQVATERIAAKRAGQSKHQPLKLGMNSVYGKLAQGQHDPHKVPEYLSYYYAGRITARTRATILRSCVLAGDGLVSVATDGVFTTRPIQGLEFGDRPGSWEEAGVPGEPVLFLQPGIMFSESGQIKKTRGFSRTSLTYHDTEGDGRDVRLASRLVPATASSAERERILRDAAERSASGQHIRLPGLKTTWLRDGALGRMSYLERRFIGIGGSVAAGRDDIFGKWLEVERYLNFYLQGNKFYRPNPFAGSDYGESDAIDYPSEYVEREHVRTFLPYDFTGIRSDPYVKPHLIDDSASEELRQMIASGEDEFDERQEQPDWADYMIAAGEAL